MEGARFKRKLPITLLLVSILEADTFRASRRYLHRYFKRREANKKRRMVGRQFSSKKLKNEGNEDRLRDKVTKLIFFFLNRI